MKNKFNVFAHALVASLLASGCISMIDAKSDREALAACSSDADCAAGLECELEHGVGTCQPHGGDDDGADDDGNDDAPPADPANPTPPVGACQTDADCGAGLECEIEHGTSFCQPHGGDDD